MRRVVYQEMWNSDQKSYRNFAVHTHLAVMNPNFHSGHCGMCSRLSTVQPTTLPLRTTVSLEAFTGIYCRAGTEVRGYFIAISRHA